MAAIGYNPALILLDQRFESSQITFLRISGLLE
jgi:hypothetical protein